MLVTDQPLPSEWQNDVEGHDTDIDFKTVECNLKALAEQMSVANVDPTSRIALQRATQKLALALETPGDSFQRIAFSPLQLVTVRIGIDLDLFRLLDRAGPQGIGLDGLAKESGADLNLLTRLLKHLVVSGVIDEQGETDYVANAITKRLCSPMSEAGMKHYHDFVTPQFIKMPEFLAKTNHKNPDDSLDGPFQFARNTTLNGFAWIGLPENAEMAKNFNIYIAGSHEGRVDWLDWFPFEAEIARGIDSESDAVAFVDVGGCHGSELKRLREKYPNLPGRLVCQDTECVIREIAAGQSFEPMVHDFFTPQPCKGARVYYLRSVLHDWPDEECRRILKNIMRAMERGYSKIIINDMVIKDRNASWTETQWDLTMMACLSAKERTETQWCSLIESVGLRIAKIWRNVMAIESIIEVELA